MELFSQIDSEVFNVIVSLCNNTEAWLLKSTNKTFWARVDNKIKFDRYEAAVYAISYDSPELLDFSRISRPFIYHILKCDAIRCFERLWRQLANDQPDLLQMVRDNTDLSKIDGIFNDDLSFIQMLVRRALNENSTECHQIPDEIRIVDEVFGYTAVKCLKFLAGQGVDISRENYKRTSNWYQHLSKNDGDSRLTEYTLYMQKMGHKFRALEIEKLIRTDDNAERLKLLYDHIPPVTLAYYSIHSQERMRYIYARSGGQWFHSNLLIYTTIRDGPIEYLQWLIESGCPWNTDDKAKTDLSGMDYWTDPEYSIKCLKFMFDNGIVMKQTDYMRGIPYEAILYIHDRWPGQFTPMSAGAAVSSGKLGHLHYIVNTGADDVDMDKLLEFAVFNGDLVMVKYLYEKYKPNWRPDTIEVMATIKPKGMKMDIIEYMVRNGHPITEYIIRLAVTNDLRLLKLLVEDYGVKLPNEAYKWITELDVLAWLIEHKLIDGRNTLLFNIKFHNNNFVDFLLSKGIKYDYAELVMAVESNNALILHTLLAGLESATWLNKSVLVSLYNIAISEREDCACSRYLNILINSVVKK